LALGKLLETQQQQAEKESIFRKQPTQLLELDKLTRKRWPKIIPFKPYMDVLFSSKTM